jgi:DNA-directed RNA polymerase specialized sigma24 family protein
MTRVDVTIFDRHDKKAAMRLRDRLQEAELLVESRFVPAKEYAELMGIPPTTADNHLWLTVKELPADLYDDLPTLAIEEES